jgi:hypothetical protein
MHPSIALATFVLVPACSVLSIEAEVPEVCMTYPNISIDGVGGATSINKSFTFDDLGGLQQLVSLDADLRFVRAEIRAKGVADLAFVDHAILTIASGDPDSTLPTREVYDCDGDCLPDGPRLEVPAGAQANALDYVQSSSIIVGVDFTGQMPAGDWSMDVDVCMNGNFEYSIDPTDL